MLCLPLDVQLHLAQFLKPWEAYSLALVNQQERDFLFSLVNKYLDSCRFLLILESAYSLRHCIFVFLPLWPPESEATNKTSEMSGKTMLNILSKACSEGPMARWSRLTTFHSGNPYELTDQEKSIENKCFHIEAQYETDTSHPWKKLAHFGQGGPLIRKVMQDQWHEYPDGLVSLRIKQRHGRIPGYSLLALPWSKNPCDRIESCRVEFDFFQNL